MLALVLITLPPVQNFLVRQATQTLSSKLKTKVSIGNIRIDFLNHLLIENLYVEDRAKDTLLFAGKAEVRITDWFILRKEVPVLRYLVLEDAYANLYRTPMNDAWNYEFIIDAFDTGPSKTPKKKSDTEFELDLEQIGLNNVRFHMDDAWAGSDMEFDVGEFELDADKIDLKKHIIDVDLIALKNTSILLRDYVGGRPPRPRKPFVIDTTAFNTGHWAVNVDKLQLKECVFRNDVDGSIPFLNEFDPEHIAITGINADARNIVIVKDTITGHIGNLAAKERSGIRIKKCSADVSVSPNASICKNLYLETNNSKLRNYYAMHYTRFPDFRDYINKVVMVATLDDAYIDSRDVAYFAPVLRNYPTVINAKGKIAGTVDSIVGKNLMVTDGASIVRGNLRMIGLPDIYTTYIEFREGDIYTTGKGVLKYAPELKDNPSISITSIEHAYFKGDFTGYIENFASKGVLTTNLGSIRSDVKLKMPELDGNRSGYSGLITVNEFDFGKLLNLPQLGPVSLKANVNGNAFDPAIASIQLNTLIDHVRFNGYNYQNINAEGVLEKKTFNGSVLIDDPNLALAFYGNADFSQKELKINATANLLKSDLNALHLVKDSIQATADFDMNWEGNNIDNFLGYAKLYNINLLRNGHRMDLDSVYINSAKDGDKKQLTVESNILSARIAGDYKLSSLPYSAQYYVSGYLPNYIKAPTQYAPDQNLTFNVVTRDIDSLLAVVSSDIKGFYNTKISGSLNMPRQQLTLDATIPYGQLYSVKMENVEIDAEGDFNILGLNAEAEHLVIGDSAVNASLSVTTTLGNDSLQFNIATTSPDNFGTATLNGKALARGDSLFFTLMPSEFFLSGTRWEIPAGSQVTVSNKYLYIRDLYLQSALQKLHIYSQNESSVQTLVLDAANIDLSLLGGIQAVAPYKPEGRVNGKVTIDSVFRHPIITGAIKTTEVKLMGDTIGNINLTGSYDAGKNVLVLDGQSGIYRGNASVTAGGRIILFDSLSKQSLDGKITFTATPLHWLTPFLDGYVSDIGGLLNGDVYIAGRADRPDVKGELRLDNAVMKVDFLGTRYTIHHANIGVDNKQIDLGEISLFDENKNTAILRGNITHNRFSDMRLNLTASSDKLDVINLKENENSTFYGNLTAGFQTLSVRGPFNDIDIRINRAVPAGPSHLFLPIGTTSAGGSSYNYVTFKTYGTEQQPVKKKSNNKLNISIDALMNDLAEITLVLDPSTGDAINAKGTGNLNLEIPLSDDIRMYGIYNITEGDYTFTLKQLYFKRRFILNSGSRISFGGPIAQTDLNVEGVYKTRTRLYDVLEPAEKTAINQISNRNDREVIAAKSPQDVNILLHMKGSLDQPQLTFNLEMPDQYVAGTIAANRVRLINQNYEMLFNQVASILLINSFVPSETNIGESGTGRTGAISNVSDILSTTASSQITNIVSKITGDKNLAIDFRYKQYSYTAGDPLSATSTTGNRNELSLGVRKNYFNNRLSLQVGSAYDWGRPTSSKSNTNNLVGDFRAEYQLQEDGNLRLNIFRTGSYDVLVDRNISRGGIGLSWRKSFNTFEEFFRGDRYAAKLREEAEAKKLLEQNNRTQSNTSGGTD